MTTSARYNTIRRRLRLTQAEVAEATGYRLGYVSKWGHKGASAVDPPEPAVARLEVLLRQRAINDLAEFGGQTR